MTNCVVLGCLIARVARTPQQLRRQEGDLQVPGISLRRLTGGRPRLVADEGEVEGGFVEGAVEQCRFVCVAKGGSHHIMQEP